MSLFIASINSGSNGNCYYIGNDTDAIFVDAGISCRETERRMKKLGLEMTKLRAIFVSHEHIDHITGVPALSKKYQLPVYISKNTFLGSKIPIEDHLLCDFPQHKTIHIGGLSVRAFTKSHDAADPHSFIITYGKIKVGVFTDIGHSCNNIKKYFSQCHAAFLESNYCETMLANGNYPQHLKKRISSDNGHLSNTQALDLFRKYRSPQLSHLLLAHLSKNNNSPELVNEMFTQHAGDTAIIVASRYQESPVVRIVESSEKSVAPHKHLLIGATQLTLFQ